MPVYKHVCIGWDGCAGNRCVTRVFSRIGEEVLPKKDAFAQDSPMEFCALEAPDIYPPVDGKLLRIVQFSSVVIRSDDVELVCASRFYHAVSSRHRQQQVGECKRRPHEATANFAKLKLRVTRESEINKSSREIAVRLKYTLCKGINRVVLSLRLLDQLSHYHNHMCERVKFRGVKLASSRLLE